MYLESLPNELLSEIFQYLSTLDVLLAFSQLNTRFDELVYTYRCTCKYIDLRATSKYNCDLLWNEYLPPLVDGIISLRLSNDVNAPCQVDQFYAHGFTLRQFTRLQSFSVFHIHSKEMMNKIVEDLAHLTSLTYLTFEKCFFSDLYTKIDTIWNLPNLVYFRFTANFSLNFIYLTPRITSSTIKSVHSFGNEESTSIIDLLKHTPQLRYLSITIGKKPIFSYLSGTISVTKLNLLFTSSRFSPLMNLLQTVPNLSHLKLDMLHNGIHAEIWERLVHEYLPKLRVLQFKMIFTAATATGSLEQQVQQITDTFRTPFWLDQHRWFVQCDCSLISEKCYVYTLPYTFENFNIDFPIYSKSTCAPDNAHCFFGHVRRLTYTATSSYLYESLTLSHIQFSNIEHITIELSAHNHFRHKTKGSDPSADVCEENCLKQLQCLLGQFHNLTSIHLNNWPLAILNLPQCDVNNVSVFELNLRCDSNHEYYYTQEQCDQLSQTRLGIQCKILTIDVDDWTCVYDLIIKMNNLQMLDVRCRYNQPISTDTLQGKDLTEWLNKNIIGVFNNIKNITRRTVVNQYDLFIERL